LAVARDVTPVRAVFPAGDRTTALKLSIVIPARNEGRAIYSVAVAAAKYADQVIVMDDSSSDNTAQRAGEAGATWRKGKIHKKRIFITHHYGIIGI